MRVLVVEDDGALGGFLLKCLQLDGHEVEWVEDGQAALDRMAERRPALLILDLSLPKKDGTEVLEALLGRFDGMAVLVLTGRCDLEVRIRCLNLGADDCMLKPFNLGELRARCRALLRRREQYADPVLRAGGLELNRIERKVTRDGQLVDLTTKEFALLEFLLQHRGLCCSRSELLREVWQMKADTGTNVVDVYINYLRRKLAAAYAMAHEGVPELGETAVAEMASELIETVRGEGYRLTEPSMTFTGIGATDQEARPKCPAGIGTGIACSRSFRLASVTEKNLAIVKTVKQPKVLQERNAFVPDAGDPATGLLRSMEVKLHELSQPMTALLCLLEYGSSLEASDEMKQVMVWSTDAIERLRVTVIAMQQSVQDEGQRRIHELNTELHGRERSFGQSNGDCGEH